MRTVTILALAAGLTLTSTAATAETVRFAVTTPRGAVEAKQQWGDLTRYLSSATGLTIEFIPLLPDQIEPRMAAGEIDFAFTNPVIAVALVERLSGKPLATVKKRDIGSHLSGVIFSKKGSGILKAEDLKGKHVMAFKAQSAAAYVFQTYHLMQKGINPTEYFASFREAKKQDDIVLAVKSGVIDAGFVLSGLLESMANEGKVSMDDFEIVDRQSVGYAREHSTALYPQWFVVARKGVDGGVTEKISAALMKLDPAKDAVKLDDVVGFVAPLDLTGLKAALKALKLAPYESS